jgi:2-oxoglutarate ferredoxin oxidoreductase subunit alpha
MLPPTEGICIQGEDEIASMGYCIGASMAGKKALTATSGPGISLYSEQISFAIGSEIPLLKNSGVLFLLPPTKKSE